jgi:exosortase/archaeosortase family protein
LLRPPAQFALKLHNFPRKLHDFRRIPANGTGMLASMSSAHTTVHHRAATVTLAAGALFLAARPARWLFGTWQEQGYDGIGWVAFVLAAALFGWSVSSPIRSGADDGSNSVRMILLLALTAVLRLAAQILDINVLGAVLLAADVYALAHLARLPARRRACSPLWLAAVFAFSLPVEPILQRVFGFALQQLSAGVACTMLTPFFDNLACAGVRLTVEGRDVLVDLPCSGAEMVSLVGLIYALICTLRQPRGPGAAAGALACLALALVGNGLRIALLAAGIARPGDLPFHVMDPVPHTLIGLSLVGLVTLALLVLSHRLPVAGVPDAPARRASGNGSVPVAPRLRGPVGYPIRFLCSLCFLAFALSVGAIQPRPVDTSPRVSSPVVPRFAAGFFSEDHPLTPQEVQYFERYGGGAARARFGPFGLLLVSTASPLRHLHDPTICLGALGYRVQLVGTDHRARSTVYVAERPSVDARGKREERYLVRVSYVSSTGQVASSIAEVVWLWLHAPGSRWTMIQRVLPQSPDIEPRTAAEWDAAMRRAFNLS